MTAKPHLQTLYAPFDKPWTIDTVDGPYTIPAGGLVKLCPYENGWKVLDTNKGNGGE